ncbi:MAG TPA: hypothetical protein VMB71_03435, partial [Acetobacteraceae bacterium]|nr:hypothetical protein [Acetobacteraceae bacterium]
VVTGLLGYQDVIAGTLWFYLGLYLLIGVTNAAILIYAALIGRIVSDRRGAATVVTVAVTLALLPVIMTGLGVLTILPRYRWLPVLMPVVVVAFGGLRRLAAAFDARRDKAVPARVPDAAGA